VHASTISASYKELEKQPFDLVIIDRLLPDGDAIEIIAYIQESFFSTRIIAISQLYQVDEKIRGLELGADDYLPKPFALGELKLKIKKLLNYVKTTEEKVQLLGSLSFDPESGLLCIDNTKATLRKKESAILECLFKYKNRVVSREKLVENVWAHQDSMPTHTTLDVYIRRIRMSMKEYGSHIVTKRGFGYMLID
jgi:DNA-binding response OmpR family regulator